MKWTKLKILITQGFCDSMRSRVSVYSTRYGNCNCGRAWITLDGKTIAGTCTRAYWNRMAYDAEKSSYVQTKPTPSEEKRYSNQWVSYGDVSRQGFYESCWAFYHTLSIDEALSSDDIIVQALAVIDRRVGKKRLLKLRDRGFHPLAMNLLLKRLEIENQETAADIKSQGHENEQ